MRTCRVRVTTSRAFSSAVLVSCVVLCSSRASRPAAPRAMGKPGMGGGMKGNGRQGGKKKMKLMKPTRGKAPGGRVYEVAQEILNAPPGGVAAAIAAALNDPEAPIRRDPRAFTMFSTRCRKKGEWGKCVEIFDAMRAQGVETNTIVFNATMSACSKGGRWERALELFDAMRDEGHERSTISYNVAMSACMRGGAWERALALFDEMETVGLVRDHVSVNTAMAAAEQGGQRDRMEALAGTAAGKQKPVPVKSKQKDDDDVSGGDDSEIDDKDDGDVGRGWEEAGTTAVAATAKEEDDDDADEEVDTEEDPLVRERRLKAQRRDARRQKFEERRRARKAAKLARPWVTGNGGEPEGAKETKRSAPEPLPMNNTTKKRKEWNGNPMKWIDEDEGVKGKKRGQDSDSDDDDEEDDGLQKITGPSILEADDEDLKRQLNSRNDNDDFWAF